MTTLSPTQAARVGAVLDLIDRGMAVFPLKPNSKLPAVKDWENRATLDRGHAEAFWTARPSHNIGVACGPSNLLVIDCDVATDDKAPPDGFNMIGISDGLGVLGELARRHRGDLPATYTVATPSTGTHLGYHQPIGVRLGSTIGTLGWLLDTRGHGGYVVAAGSTLPNGGYELIDDADPVELPAWLVQALSPKPPMAVSGRNEKPVTNPNRLLDAIVASEQDKVRAAQPRFHNKTLFQAALTLGQLVAGNELDHTEAFFMLQQAAQPLVAGACRCTQAEVDATIRSGLRLGGSKARHLTPQEGSMNAHPRVRVLSIRQPWAELILAGHKHTENRAWGTRWRGRLVVHAGQRLDPFGIEVAESLGIDLDPVLPRGYLGAVDLTDVHHDRGDCGDRWAEPDALHWCLARPQRFPIPISGPGQRGLYPPPAAVLSAAFALDTPTANLWRSA